MRQRAVLMLLFSAFLWSVSFPITRALSLVQGELHPQMSSWFLTAVMVLMRFAGAALILALVKPSCLKNLSRLELSQGAGLGLFGALGIVFQIDALAYTDASVSAFLTQCYCLWIPAYLCLRDRRWPGPKLLVAVVLVFLGIFILSGVDLKNLSLERGESETLVASLFFTAQILWLERPRYSRNRTVSVTFIMFVTFALVSLPFAFGSLHTGHEWHELFSSPRFVPLILVLLVFCTFVPFLTMNYFQRFLPATEAGILYCAEPIFTSFITLFLPGLLSTWIPTRYPNEHLTSHLLWGGLLVTTANVLVQYQSKKQLGVHAHASAGG